MRVLDAARELFESVGYEAATVRDIARVAGVSVGSVFTTFSSKADILSHVVHERLDALYGELDRVAPNLRGSTADRLRSIFALHFSFEAHRTPLLLAYIAASFGGGPQDGAQTYAQNGRLRGILRACLAEGVGQGDVDDAIDLDVVVDMLIAAYAWTYRLAAQEGADAEALSAALDRQIGFLAGGFEPRKLP